MPNTTFAILGLIGAMGLTGLTVVMLSPKENEQDNKKLLDSLKHHDRIKLWDESYVTTEMNNEEKVA